MSKLEYSKQEIEAEHDYQTLHVECGQKLHGGFDPDGCYLSPRTRHRWEAINNWHKQLDDRGVPIVEASTTLLTEPNFPNVPQQVLLLKHGIEQSFWDSLTITGLIEARGKALAEVQAPDFQSIIVEDISATALAHMNKGFSQPTVGMKAVFLIPVLVVTIRCGLRRGILFLGKKNTRSRRRQRALAVRKLNEKCLRFLLNTRC